MLNKVIIISFDGTSASGKSVIAKRIANILNFDFLGTGLMYRQVASIILKTNININNKNKIIKIIKTMDLIHANHKNLQSNIISEIASIIAVCPSIRKTFIQKQRKFIKKQKGIVVDGRDVSTNIFPQADCKFYLDANLNVRSARRFKQLQKKGNNIIYNDVYKYLKTRDKRDQDREYCPLLKSNNSIFLDTTNNSVKDVFNKILKKINNKLYL